MTPSESRYDHLLQNFGGFYEYNVEDYTLVQVK